MIYIAMMSRTDEPMEGVVFDVQESQGCWDRGAGAGSAYFQKSPGAGAFRERFLYNT